jgi:hypothetical protein
MSSVPKKSSFFFSCLFLLLLAFQTSAAEQKDWKRFRFELEGGPVWQTKNDVRIPGNTGTEFSFKDLTGSGPYAAGRFTFDWNFLERHGLRLEMAPLRIDGNGMFDQPVSFAGTRFPLVRQPKANTNLIRTGFPIAIYFLIKTSWRMHVGATLLVRDAKIELEQAG